MSMRRFLVLACLPGFLAACSPSGSTVEMIPSHRFDPETITVNVGDTVSWRVRTDEPHSVTAYEESLPEGAEYFASGGFSSEEDARANTSVAQPQHEVAEGLLQEGDGFEVTFETPGTYEYFCIPHESEGMTGTVVVEE